MKLRPLLHAPSTRLRSHLFRDLLLLLLVTTGALIAAGALLINDIKQSLAEERISAATSLVRDEMLGLLTPVRQQLLILQDALRDTARTPADRQALNALLMPTLRHIPQIAGGIFADTTGADYLLRRDQDGWITRERLPVNIANGERVSGRQAPDGAGEARFTLTRWSAAGEPERSWVEQGPYDPRQRPWFRLALNALQGDQGAVVWSPPYRFASSGVPGTTVSVAWRDAGDVRVAAFDLTLARIIAAIDRLDLGRHGHGFLFSADGGVYSDRAQASAERGFYSAERQQGGTLAFEAVAAWRAAGEPDGQLVGFESGGRRWWGGFVPLHPDNDSVWVGVAIASSPALGALQSRWPLVAGLGAAILGLGIGLALLVVRKYGRELQAQPKTRLDPDDPQRDLYDLIGRGEGTHLELKSTMRTNLHTGKPGKEIELAWLKGVTAFLNTEGGILLMGVADDGEVLGLTADAFDNDDKRQLHYKNLINQHIGPEYNRFLHFGLFQLEGRQIAAVQCEPADGPVFLRHKNGESFLIRTGPSNIELPISKALGYIRARF
ncbi:ATP-binding protein [Thiohalocapsa marina]|uniref:ATP-binding protein n=1 Tax=Thiohalocapsa marina TaxID=424902 RepID=A0A5M8FLU3_9GAMM|nr:RNA-binding domain-containing protein [Thiohalocapsa marina]KAA6185818.1 ATP-binding protein [Thiohalocapsa marina]